MEHCHNCGQEIIEIDGLGLSGCLTCNLWTSAVGDRWVRHSEEDCRHVCRARMLAAQIDGFDPEWLKADGGPSGNLFRASMFSSRSTSLFLGDSDGKRSTDGADWISSRFAPAILPVQIGEGYALEDKQHRKQKAQDPI